MHRRSTPPTLFPLALWWQLGLKTCEMLLASGQVIGWRRCTAPQPPTHDGSAAAR